MYSEEVNRLTSKYYLYKLDGELISNISPKQMEQIKYEATINCMDKLSELILNLQNK